MADHRAPRRAPRERGAHRPSRTFGLTGALVLAAATPLVGATGVSLASASTTDDPTASLNVGNLVSAAVDVDACVQLRAAVDAAQHVVDTAPSGTDTAPLLKAVTDAKVKVGEAGCNDPAPATSTTTAPPSSTSGTLPPVLGGTGGDGVEPKDDEDCDDFATQAAAQDHYNADRSDPDHLDVDDDGVACETSETTKIPGSASSGSSGGSDGDGFSQVDVPVGAADTGDGSYPPAP